jgi:hypothetical protein
MTRAVSRLRLVLPEGPSALLERAGAVPEPIELLARGFADALASHGVVVRQQTHRGLADGAPRADVAVWFPGADGLTVPPDVRLVPSRVHAAVVVDPASPSRDLARYDALYVLLASHVGPVRDAAHKSGRKVPVSHVRLCGTSPARDAEKAERGVAGNVVLVDMRRTSSTGADAERTVLQLALRNDSATLVLVSDDDDTQRRRLRLLCDRHAVSAWLTAGPEAMATAIVAADLVIGALRWDEVLLTASARCALITVPFADGRGSALSMGLRDSGVVDELPGTLQLAAALDRRLKDDGGLQARGLGLHEALFQPARSVLDALAETSPLPGTLQSATQWEAVGPLAATVPPTVVVAVDPQTTPKVSTAQRIEDDLAALKARLAAERDRS